MALVGFMGRCDSAPQGIGESLIVDAARGVHRSQDIVAWGLMVDSEGGLVPDFGHGIRRRGLHRSKKIQKKKPPPRGSSMARSENLSQS
jgi:hypothetical protein